MELYTMRYVLAVADHGNFSAAAETCHVGQPALSQQIARLERELGVLLFYRSSRGAVLTEAGRAFVLRAREILQKSDALEAEMASFAGLKRGSLSLGIISSLRCIRFGDLLSGFCRAYPDISINLIQEGTYRLLELLIERKIDLAFLNKPARRLPSSVDFLRLGEASYSLAVPASHPLAGREMVSLRELSEERFIFHQNSQVASELCLAACREAGFEPNILCRSASPSHTLYMVQSGMGAAILPEEELSPRTLDGVVQVKLKEAIIKEVGIAWRIDAASPLLDTCLDFAREWTTRLRA